MALYAALAFWLYVIIFLAWGVYAVWCRLLKPRVVNAILLPGTLVAQLGHVVGLLVTGNAVTNLRLMGDNKTGAPEADTPKEPAGVPILSPALVGLLPLVFCAACLHVAAQQWGGVILAELAGMPQTLVAQSLPASRAEFWDLLRNAVTQMEQMVGAIVRSDLPNWPTALFLYLAICLTVRMAPFPGNRRGALVAVLVASAVVAVLASVVPAVRTFIEDRSWPALSVAVATLLCLMLASLVVAGAVGLAKVLVRGG